MKRKDSYRQAHKRNHNILIIIIVSGLVCISTIGVLIVKLYSNKTVAASDNKNFKDITLSDRKKSLKPVKANEVEEVVPSKEGTKAVANKNKVDYKAVFKNDVFIGDSISEGLNFYDYLDDSNVIAKKGMSISAAVGEMDTLVSLNPKNIYVLFGVNDMGATTSSQWIGNKYTDLVHAIKSKLPNANIYIQSIMPVLPKVETRAPYITNAHIIECNNKIIEMTKIENINYLDIASVVNTNKNLYEGDGIHFKPQFYPLWLDYVISKSKK